MSEPQAPTVDNVTSIQMARDKYDGYSLSLFEEPGQVVTHCEEALSNATKLIATRMKGGKDVA